MYVTRKWKVKQGFLIKHIKPTLLFQANPAELMVLLPFNPSSILFGGYQEDFPQEYGNQI
jgi:hypothetical protein